VFARRLQRGVWDWCGVAAGVDRADLRWWHAGVQSGVDDRGESRQRAVLVAGGCGGVGERYAGAHGVFYAVVGGGGGGGPVGAVWAAVAQEGTVMWWVSE